MSFWGNPTSHRHEGLAVALDEDQFFLRANAQKLQGAESVKALSRAASCPQASERFLGHAPPFPRGVQQSDNSKQKLSIGPPWSLQQPFTYGSC